MNSPHLSSQVLTVCSIDPGLGSGPGGDRLGRELQELAGQLGSLRPSVQLRHTQENAVADAAQLSQFLPVESHQRMS